VKYLIQIRDELRRHNLNYGRLLLYNA